MKEQEIFDLYDLLLEQMRDLFDGERRQLGTLREFDDQASSFELKEVIEHHARETKQQITRLEEAFRLLDESPEGETCDGIKGLVKEARKLVNRCQNPEVVDAAIITAIQHINHYEMAGYGTAVSYAKTLGHHDVAEILLSTLREEKEADYGLSDLAVEHINLDATWDSIVGKADEEAAYKG